MEKENKKKLNINDVDEVKTKNIPRILNEIYSPKNEKYFLKKNLEEKETIKIKSLDKVIDLYENLLFFNNKAFGRT